MTRKSKREIEQDVERLEGGDEMSQAEAWRRLLRGDLDPREYYERGATDTDSDRGHEDSQGDHR